MDLVEAVKAVGVVGTDRAGFPTHVKLSARAECFVMNGAECEPLIEADKYLMRIFPDQIIQAVDAVAAHVGTKRAVIALRKKYVKETAALRQAITTSDAQIKLFGVPSSYPAEDEQVLIQQVCDTSVPERGVPLGVGAVIDNVGILLSIYDALQGTPMAEKYLSVVGEVERPAMRKVPLGAPLRECIGNARPHLQDCIVIVGSPMMGRVITDPAEVDRLTVMETAGSLIVLSNEHYLARRAALPLGRIKTQAENVRVQCRICTSLCPRYLVGHQIQPCLMMRSLFREELIFDNNEYEKAFGQAINCCNCGMCEMFSCPMGLSPHKVNACLKGRLREKGIQIPRNLSPRAREGSSYGKMPTDHLVTRLGPSEYYHQHAGDDCTEPFPEQVWISFWQHIGKPAVPAVWVGETVQEGDLLASTTQGLSASIHTSINRIITEINGNGASICRDREVRGQ